MATEKEIYASRIFLRAALPLVKVIMKDRPELSAKYAGLNAKVQFVARDAAGDVGAYFLFTDGALEVLPNFIDEPDLTLDFKSIGAMNGFFAGKLALPKFKGGLSHLGLLLKTVNLCLRSKLSG